MSHWSQIVADNLEHYAACRVNCEALDYCLCPDHGDDHECTCADVAAAMLEAAAEGMMPIEHKRNHRLECFGSIIRQMKATLPGDFTKAATGIYV